MFTITTRRRNDSGRSPRAAVQAVAKNNLNNTLCASSVSPVHSVVKNLKTAPVSRPQSPVAARHRRAAFTLIELLTVIAILAIVAAIGLPALVELLSGNGQTQAAAQVSAAVQRARSLALQLNAPVALVFFEESGYTGQTGMAYEAVAPGSAIGFAAGSGVSITFNLYPSIASQFLPNGTYVAAFVGSNGAIGGGTSVSGTNIETSTYTTPPSYNPPSSPPFLFPNTYTTGYPFTYSTNTYYSNVYGAIVFNAQGQIVNIPYGLMYFQSPDSPSSSTAAFKANFPSSSAICVFQPGTFSSSVITWPITSSTSGTNASNSLAALATQLTNYQDLVVFNPYTGTVFK